MNVFELREKLVTDYSAYTQSFLQIRDQRIREYVQGQLEAGLLWPEPLVQLNPLFEPGAWIDELVDERILSAQCRDIFRIKTEEDPLGKPLRLHKHQEEAVRIARGANNYVLTTGTGSGKSLAYIVPIVDTILRLGAGSGIKAIIVYSMNALANSQLGELEKFINLGFPNNQGPLRFRRYTGQERDEEREEIVTNPPDILLTNYVMLEYILTRPRERQTLVQAAQGLRFFVLDELHTYRGRQGSDVALLVRRVRDALGAADMQCVGTSATLAGGGSFADQQREVAAVSSKIFGGTVPPDCVIGESLSRATPEFPDFDAATSELRDRLAAERAESASEYATFIDDPLSSWIESKFGVSADESGRLTRNLPISIPAAARDLSGQTDIAESACASAIRSALMTGFEIKHPDTGFPTFAFRLHQFISRGDTVYASAESTNDRHITVQGQQFVPGRHGDLLLPVVFCRQCGQDYYVVRREEDAESATVSYSSRDVSDRLAEEGGEAGFLYVNEEAPWSDDPADVIKNVPSDWLEEFRGQLRVRRNRRKPLPRRVRVSPQGIEAEGGAEAAFIPAPFRFCVSCGIAYGFRQTSDFGKLARLGSEGRSTATTIMSLSSVLGLRELEGLKDRARKLLSFTDNRQDASLQSGHFNDFIEIGLMRAALYKAVLEAGKAGLLHDEIGEKVVESLDLPKDLFAQDPEVRFAAETETRRAFRDVVCYRLYRDLKRGWRIIAPNLEQCGLLEIRYESLDEACAEEDLWGNTHPAIAQATPELRANIAKVFLDYLRRELAIKVDYLDQDYQDRMSQRSRQHLREPWGIDENERLEHATVIYPRSGQRDDYQGHVFVSGRGGFGQYLGRATTFPDWNNALPVDDRQQIISDLLESLRKAGIVSIADDSGDVNGYQLSAAALRWVAGDGTKPFLDPITVPNEPEGGGRTNPYFVGFYRDVALNTKGVTAKEHTAQVPYEERVNREDSFREGRLPVLYCSPTMELGIDIAELNVVSMRNVPPTPANYAQRSGRAGRSGQPALVFTYCATGNSHDQYFFKRPERMVAGAVTPPRLDLANEDLIRAHLQAIWLAESGLDLGSSLRDVLDLQGHVPSLALLPAVEDTVNAAEPRVSAISRAKAVLESCGEELSNTHWYSDEWLEDVFSKVPLEFSAACERWRGLYNAAREQFDRQNAIIADASRSQPEKKRARRLRNEADNQLQLLTEAQNISQSDFYSYRYFASEGFLPGYNFPRLPISAFIPGRRNTDEFISRPRFLAISEFGPRAIIYHEGARYLINRVIMPPRDDDDTVTQQAKRCQGCGYLHVIAEGDGPDLCEHCGELLDPPLRSLFRMQSVATRRRDRINSDEEERQRLGYELLSGFRFAEHSGVRSQQSAHLEAGDARLVDLTYGQAATLWRINLGWRRRANRSLYGFILDTERGFWQRNELMNQDDDPEDPMSQMRERVVPFVEDRRNCLVIEPSEADTEPEIRQQFMATLQAALKSAIQVLYQLEDNELAADPLPAYDNRRFVLLYEAAEGGAGVLRRLVEDPNALPRVAKEALELCHFDPDTGEDRRRGTGMVEDCEAACYECLMSYGNQRDHSLLDRHLIRDWLIAASQGNVEASPTALSRTQHLNNLKSLAGSNLEKRWLQFLEDHDYRLPSAAQRFMDQCATRPDFMYESQHAVVYIDGPPHDYPQRQLRDQEQTTCLEDLGYEVIRFHHQDEWSEIVEHHLHIFGTNA
jgi:ATP-dependent helicase YprA (DUF1998 family)/very-short-patch-repair endonuclease